MVPSIGFETALWQYLENDQLYWRRGVAVITTAQLNSDLTTELRFCAGSNPARGVSEICNGENL